MAEPDALAGLRVLLARPPERCADLRHRLTRLGAVVEARATFVLEPAPDAAPAEGAVRRLAEFDWVVFTSANGVRFFRDRCRACGVRDMPPGPRWAAVGATTGRALVEALGVSPDLVGDADGAALGAALGPRLTAGARLLWVRPERAAEGPLAALEGRGVQAEEVVFYRSVAAPDLAQTVERVGRGDFDAAVFASPSGLERLLEPRATQRVLAALSRMIVVAIGPVTSRALETVGIARHSVAERPTDDAVIRALTEGARLRGKG
ncbi:MAG: uroporphyrinogen-III synthase [bacterium]|nr:uroporphyrinogen-III synthase [bacterium]